MESISTQGAMLVCLTWPVYVPKLKCDRFLLREFVFADDAELVTHSEEALQRLINSFAHARGEFSLTNSLTRTNIMDQDVNNIANITIGDHTLEAIKSFT